MDNFKLIVITHPDAIQNEVQSITKLFESGLERLHLRKQNWNIEQINFFLNDVPSEFHSKIVLHINNDCINKLDKITHIHNIKGIHLSNLFRNNYSDFLKKGYNIVSTSCHSLDELIYEKNNYEYLFLSPIFNSISKLNYTSAFSVKQLLKAKSDRIIDEKIVALGGINIKNIKSIMNLGFGGAAMLGTIWNK